MGVADMSENECPQCHKGEMVPEPKYHPTDRTSKWYCPECDFEMTPEPDYEEQARAW